MAKPIFDWKDPFMLDQQLSDEERMVRDTARQFSRDVPLPRVTEDFRQERFDPVVMQQRPARSVGTNNSSGVWWCWCQSYGLRSCGA